MISGGYYPHIMPQPQILVAMRIPELSPRWAGIPFVIDTGASRSVIHALDAMGKFGVPPARLDPGSWANALPMGGVGGGVITREVDAEYAFRDDDGSFLQLRAPILIGDVNTQTIPSLLGIDILSRFELRLTATTVVLIPA